MMGDFEFLYGNDCKMDHSIECAKHIFDEGEEPTAPGNVVSIGDLIDVDVETTVPVIDNVLKFNGAVWVPVEDTTEVVLDLSTTYTSDVITIINTNGTDATIVLATDLVAGAMSPEAVTKLASFEVTDLLTKSIYDTDSSGVVDNAEKVNGLTVETAVPSGALFTDTIYDASTLQAEVDLNTAKITYPTEDSNKLNSIENNATADQTNTEIKTLYESNVNTNVYDDDDKAKLTSIEGTHFRDSFATEEDLLNNLTTGISGDYAVVDGAGIDVMRYLWDATESKWVAQMNNLNDAQIKSMYENNTDTNPFNDNTKTKLEFITVSDNVDLDSIKSDTEINNSKVGVTTEEANDANTTLEGNTFNGIEQLVKTDVDGKLPIIDGSNLTNLPSGASTFTDLTDSPADYTGGAGKLVKVNATEDGLIYGDPSGSTVSWGDLSGTLSDQTDLQLELDDRLLSVQAGTNVTIDNTDDQNPVINASLPTDVVVDDDFGSDGILTRTSVGVYGVATNVVKDNVVNTFTASQRTSIDTLPDDTLAIDFRVQNNMSTTLTVDGLVSVATDGLVGCTGQSGVLTVIGGEHITGFSSDYVFKNTPTTLVDTEVFPYFVESETVIRIGVVV